MSCFQSVLRAAAIRTPPWFRRMLRAAWMWFHMRGKNVNTAQYWDTIYASNGDRPRHTCRDYQLVHDAIVPLVPEGSRVLDVGCGDGRLCQALASKGCQVVGLDFSGRAIDICRSKGIHARRCVLPSIPAEIGTFDVVICSSVLAHLEKPDKTVAAMADHVSDDGLVIITVPAPAAIDRNLEHLHLFDRKDLLRLLGAVACAGQCVLVAGNPDNGQCDHWIAWGKAFHAA